MKVNYTGYSSSDRSKDESTIVDLTQENGENDVEP